MNETIFLRLLSPEDKASLMADAIIALREGQPSPLVYAADSASFRQIPGSPFAYWVSSRIRHIFTEFPRFEGQERIARQGLATADDYRFVRAWWEVSSSKMVANLLNAFSNDFRQQTFSGKRWMIFAKGGIYSPYYSDPHLLVNWEQDGQEIKAWAGSLYNGSHWSRIIKNVEHYFRPGLTYPRRTTSGLSVRIMPAGCIFADKGPAIFVSNDDESSALSLVALMQSEPFSALLKLQLGAATAAARSYEVGLIQQMPVPPLSAEIQDELACLAREAHNLKREKVRDDEVTHPFTRPALARLHEQTTLAAAAAMLTAEDEVRQQRLVEIQHEIDDRAYALYGISSEDRAQIEQGEPVAITEDADAEPGAENEDEAEEIAPADREQLLRVTCADLLMYAVGCAFGRWDIRIGRDYSLAPLLAEPFAPLPVCAPGTLVGPDGLPSRPGHIVSEAWLRARPDAITLPPEGSVASLTIPDENYPLSIAWNGILADDSDHEADILRRVRAVLDLLWGKRAEAIEAEACGILGVRDLRDYFRNPRNFFNHHIGRYSKSRRKAPIYWLLQSPGKRYGLWLYYHRLDPDLLFKVLTLYVQPKIRLEESRLHEMRAARQSAGDRGAVARQAGQAVERQETLLADLRDFHDRLERAAKLYLTPDLNDGVLLNIAPLWELVPWKEAKGIWEQLLAGKYGWSSVGKQLREKGLVKEK